MNCEELTQLLPDLVDGSLSADLRAEAEAALARCPDCQRELEAARQIRTLLVALQAENRDVHVPAGFEVRLLARIHRQHSGLELLDLSSQAFFMWLVELLNLIGALIDPNYEAGLSRPQTAGD
jgi:predicted anti-sigma-YlaC factor YlaD